MWSDQASNAALNGYEEATSAAAQHELIHKILHAGRPGNLGTITRHQIARTHPDKRLFQLQLVVLGAGRLQQKPAYESDPQPVQSGPVEKLIDPQPNKNYRHHLTGACSDHRGSFHAPGEPPDNGTQDASSIQRIARQHVEYSQA